MNEIGNKFLPIGDKLMPGMHLKQPGFTYRACGPFPKNKKRIEKFMQTGNMEYKKLIFSMIWLMVMAYRFWACRKNGLITKIRLT